MEFWRGGTEEQGNQEANLKTTQTTMDKYNRERSWDNWSVEHRKNINEQRKTEECYCCGDKFNGL